MAQTQGTWISDPAAYRDRLARLVGGSEPLAVLGATANALAEIVESHTPAELRARPFVGKWTPNEIIGHLGDSEWVYGFRVRLILAEDRPQILGMDQELWVAAQQHDQREPTELVERFRDLRRHNLAFWRRLTPSDLERYGRHDERGDESLGMMLAMLAGHDLSHLEQIRRYLAAAKGT